MKRRGSVLEIVFLEKKMHAATTTAPFPLLASK